MLGGICVFTTIALAVNLLQINAYYYCGDEIMAKLCPNGEKHFMCDKEAIVSQSKFVSNAIMSNSMRRFLLDLHNHYRNKIAGGEETGSGTDKFPKAARMRELIWDWELAYIANEHANRCAFEHDKCHNTVRFPYSGQNLGYAGGSKPKKVKEVLAKTILDMYNEKNAVTDPVNMIKKLSKTYTSGVTGHFTVIVNDRTSRVGCGFASCEKSEKPKYNYYMTCNFDMTNIREKPIYAGTDGDAASDCSHWNTGKSSDYENLCANSGEIFE